MNAFGSSEGTRFLANALGTDESTFGQLATEAGRKAEEELVSGTRAEYRDRGQTVNIGSTPMNQ